MSQRLVVLMTAFVVVGCSATARSPQASQPYVSPERVTSTRVLLEHPVPGWQGVHVSPGSGPSAVYVHESGLADVVIDLYDIADSTPVDTCEAMRRIMVQNQNGQVSYLKNTADGRSCSFIFWRNEDGRRIRGEFSASFARSKYLLLVKGQWPEEAHESRYKDYETIKGSIVLLER